MYNTQVVSDLKQVTKKVDFSASPPEIHAEPAELQDTKSE